MVRMIVLREKCEYNFSLLSSAKNLLLVLILRLQSSISIMLLFTGPTRELWREDASVVDSESMFISEIEINAPYVLYALRFTISVDIFLSLKVTYGKGNQLRFRHENPLAFFAIVFPGTYV